MHSVSHWVGKTHRSQCDKHAVSVLLRRFQLGCGYCSLRRTLAYAILRDMKGPLLHAYPHTNKNVRFEIGLGLR